MVQLGIDRIQIWPPIYRGSDVQSINMTTQQEMRVVDKVSISFTPNLGAVNMRFYR